MVQVDTDAVLGLAERVHDLAVAESLDIPTACAGFMLAYLVACTGDVGYSIKVLADASKAAQQIVQLHRDVQGTVQ